MTGQGADLPTPARHYISKHRPRSRAEFEWHHGQKSLDEAIANAAWAKNRQGKRHRHQTRLKKAALIRAERLLLEHKNLVRKCRTFAELFRLSEQLFTPVRGLGELYIYDTSQRLGAYLGLKPKKVYLHSGTRVGARRLGLDWRKDTLEMSELPTALQALTPSEAEDFLCIYKDHFPGLHEGRRTRVERTCG
jgi:hypothetical protein